MEGISLRDSSLFIEFPDRVNAYDLFEQDDCFTFVVIGYECDLRPVVLPRNLLHRTNLHDELSVAVVTNGQLTLRRLFRTLYYDNPLCG